MGVIVNVSMCRFGGSHQVAVSLLKNITLYPEIDFVLINENLQDYLFDIPLEKTKTISNRLQLNIFLLRNKDKVLFNLFSPAWTFFSGNQISGFARPHLIYPLENYWKSLSLRQHILYKTKLWLQRIYFKRLGGTLICETEDCADRVSKIFGKHTLVVPNVVNELHRQRYLLPKMSKGDKDNPIVIALIGYPYPHKNFEIVSDILQHLPSSTVFEVLCTFDSSQFFGEIDKRFRFLGKVRVEDLYLVYQKADIVLLPTFLECFSATWIEAMWFNRPLITSDIPSARSVCKDAALYAEPIDAKGFADKINLVLESDDIRKALVQKGKKIVKDYLGSRDAEYAEKIKEII